MGALQKLVTGFQNNQHMGLDHDGTFDSMVERGYQVVPRGEKSPRYQRLFLEAQQIINGAMTGNHWAIGKFKEALTTSDFPVLFADVLDRQLLAYYQEVPYTWSMYAKRSTLPDFREAKRFRTDYGAGLLEPIGQVQDYPEGLRTAAVYTLQLQKYGKRIPFAWETIVNDDLDALRNTPLMLAIGARRSEENYVTQLYAANATVYNAGNKNIVDSSILPTPPSTAFVNPPLSITGLQNALLVMASQLDLDGQPISVQGVTLVVPPALEVTAMNILNATAVEMNDFGGTTSDNGAGATANKSSAQRLMAQNWMRNRLSLAVNYYLPLNDTVQGNKGWYIFANPNQGRPGLEMAFLRGQETPQLFMKASNAIAITQNSGFAGNGAMVAPMDGDFDTDSVNYKIRHVFGGTMLDPIMTVWSKGTGA